MKILLIEDELKLAEFIKKALTEAGFVVDHQADGTSGLACAMINAYDLVILDLMLPSQNGFEVLKNLRNFNNQVPVTIISALSNTEHVVTGLDLGANDYLKKPFEMSELLARVRVWQRQKLAAGNSRLTLLDLEIDVHKRTVKRAGKNIELSNREFLLLELLATQADQVLSKSYLLEKIWNMTFDPGSNVIEVHLYQLRKKLNEGFAHQHIQTVVNRGYTLKST
ncbi:response regulator transcription factor [Mucilaginibacter sp. 21P]|uniref:response regulator n=1 Tax=Mucilaginibacter sp. 21P TaxID=2778902 RepID=UPI001C59C744|nr:response regulator transcription factor [Mucilaginibacter sp. 21P]QXV63757.1 response regulator transcription factor [Mucilaginibacter sp. 21P]